MNPRARQEGQRGLSREGLRNPVIAIGRLNRGASRRSRIAVRTNGMIMTTARSLYLGRIEVQESQPPLIRIRQSGIRTAGQRGEAIYPDVVLIRNSMRRHGHE